MGLSSDSNTPQVRESDALISGLRARGVAAQRPFARFETILDD